MEDYLIYHSPTAHNWCIVCVLFGKLLNIVYDSQYNKFMPLMALFTSNNNRRIVLIALC